MIRAHWVEPWWGLFAGLAWAAFWVLVIAVLIGVMRNRGGVAGPRGGSPAALRLLEERYARGEVTREEFLERRGVLAGDGGPGEASP